MRVSDVCRKFHLPTRDRHLQKEKKREEKRGERKNRVNYSTKADVFWKAK